MAGEGVDGEAQGEEEECVEMVRGEKRVEVRRAEEEAEGAEGFAKVRRGKILRILDDNLSGLCG